VGTRENRRPEASRKTVRKKGARAGKDDKEHTKSGVHVKTAFWPIDNCGTPDLVDNHQQIGNPPIKYAMYHVRHQLTFIPTLYNLSYPDFRFKGSTARKQRQAINSSVIVLESEYSPKPTGIKTVTIQESSDVMDFDCVYGDNRKDRTMKMDDMYVASTYRLSWGNGSRLLQQEF
jgi:hypothetical protein